MKSSPIVCILAAVTLAFTGCATPGYVNVKPIKDLSDPSVKPRVVFLPTESIGVQVGGGEFTGHNIAVIVKNKAGEAVHKMKEAPLHDGKRFNASVGQLPPGKYTVHVIVDGTERGTSTFTVSKS